MLHAGGVNKKTLKKKHKIEKAMATIKVVTNILSTHIYAILQNFIASDFFTFKNYYWLQTESLCSYRPICWGGLKTGPEKTAEMELSHVQSRMLVYFRITLL